MTYYLRHLDQSSILSLISRTFLPTEKDIWQEMVIFGNENEIVPEFILFRHQDSAEMMISRYGKVIYQFKPSPEKNEPSIVRYYFNGDIAEEGFHERWKNPS